jgi:hypothetical protein
MIPTDWHSAIAERCKHLTGLGKLPPREHARPSHNLRLRI